MQTRMTHTQLRQFAEMRLNDLLTQELAEPGCIQWPSSSRELISSRDAILGSMGDSMVDFLDVSIIASCLLLKGFPDPPPVSWWREHFPCRLFEDGDFRDEWASFRWVSVPVPAHVPSGKARLLFFLVGSGQDGDGEALLYLPHARDALSPQSRQVMEDAFAAAKTVCSFPGPVVVLPMLVPGEQPVRGRSMGLPLALGMLAARTGESIASNLMATGDINPLDGRIRRVGDENGTLRAKLILAMEKKYRAFLLPTENGTVPFHDESLEIIGVSSLAQAWYWARLFHPDGVPARKRLELALSGADEFVTNCGSISPELIEWAGYHEKDRLEALIGEISRNDGHVKKLVQGLDDALHGESTNLERARALASLIPAERLPDLDFSPLAAFRWCCLNLTLANHSGLTAAAHEWELLAEKYEEPAKKADIRAFARFVNHQFVGERHNRYRFASELPARFQELLDRERKIHSLNEGAGVNYLLGSFCGTVAQNFAFCGPEFLQHVRYHVREAQDAFGNGEVRDYVEDWKRQLNYLYYALMDAGHLEEARLVLARYIDLPIGNLEAHSGESDEDDALLLNPLVHHLVKLVGKHGFGEVPYNESFEIATIVRFLGDFMCRLPETSRKAVWQAELLSFFQRLAETHPTRHPWQLILHNAGRTARSLGHRETARSLWSASVSLCKKMGETVRVMALMPLAVLHYMGALDDEFHREAQGIVSLIRESRFLDRNHFDSILGKADDLPAMLSFVSANTARLFPFVYR